MVRGQTLLNQSDNGFDIGCLTTKTVLNYWRCDYLSIYWFLKQIETDGSKKSV